jgi:16S rRNA (uracil1498-N3)-methyltransferase
VDELGGFAAASSAVAHVLVDELADACTVGGRDGHHLQRVRRLRVGEAVTAADGGGRWRPYRVSAAGQGEVELEATGAVRIEPRLSPGLAVAFGVTKGDTPDVVTGQLTQLGVDRIVAVTMARSVARWEGGRAGHARERLERVAREAAMQSRRSRLPEIVVEHSLDPLLGHPGLVVAERGGGRVADLAPPDGGEWLAVIGPEGGFGDEERERLAGAPSVSLGPYQLRAGTAVTAVAGWFTSRRQSAMFSREEEPSSRGPRENNQFS